MTVTEEENESLCLVQLFLEAPNFTETLVGSFSAVSTPQIARTSALPCFKIFQLYKFSSQVIPLTTFQN